MIDRKSDLITGLLIVFLVSLLSANVLRSDGELRDWVLVAFALGVAGCAGVFLLLKGLILPNRKRLEQDPGQALNWAAEKRAALLALGALLFILSLDILSFWVSSYVMLVIVYAGMKGFRLLRTWGNAALFALLVCIPAYVLFDRVFVLSLPSGPF